VRRGAGFRSGRIAPNVCGSADPGCRKSEGQVRSVDKKMKTMTQHILQRKKENERKRERKRERERLKARVKFDLRIRNND
jgi:hypothetical protein